MQGTKPYVIYCRFSAVVFLLVSLYTLAVKIPSGGLADDWLHTSLHVATAALALHLGWVRTRGAGPVLYTWSVVTVYGLLGVAGWFIDGIAMGTLVRVPLGAADNVFHLLLAGTGVAVGLQARAA